MAKDQWDEKLRGKKMSEQTGWTIYKYQMPVKEKFTLELPRGAKILRVADQDGLFWLWALVDIREPDETRHFWAFKCGAPIPDDIDINGLEYIGWCAIFVQQELALYIMEDRNTLSVKESVSTQIKKTAVPNVYKLIKYKNFNIETGTELWHVYVTGHYHPSFQYLEDAKEYIDNYCKDNSNA